MIFAEELIKSIFKKKINFFTGVPDSILKPLSEILQKKNKKSHIIATNEGSAIALGIGYYLSTKKIPYLEVKFFKSKKALYHLQIKSNMGSSPSYQMIS